MADFPSTSLVAELALAPAPQEPNFTADMSTLILKYADRSYVRETLNTILRDERSSQDLRFRAFFALHLHFRRYKDLGDLMNLTREFRPVFAQEPIWPFVESMTLYYCDVSPGDLRMAELLAVEAAESFPDGYFPLAHRAMVMARRFKRQGVRDRSELEDAIRMTRRALRMSSERYARFWSVLAELLIIDRRFDEAESALDRAIELEDSSSSDYPLRLSEYQAQRIDAQVARHHQMLGRRADDAVTRVDAMQSEILALLGLLAAVIAFLATSVQIVTGMNFEQGSRLAVLSGGVILVVFAGFSMTFQTGPAWRKLLVGLFGSVIVAAILFIG